MRLICDVNQRECVQYGVPVHSSTVEIDVDPKLLTLEQRDLIVENLYDGTRFPRDSELNICPPTYAGLLASVACGIARKHEKGKRALYVALTATATIINKRMELRERLIKAAISQGVD